MPKECKTFIAQKSMVLEADGDGGVHNVTGNGTYQVVDDGMHHVMEDHDGMNDDVMHHVVNDMECTMPMMMPSDLTFES